MGPVDSVKIQLSVVLGKSILPINQLLRMGRGAVIELDSTEEDDVDILANNVLIARGEVSIHSDRIAVTVREMTRSMKRRPQAMSSVEAQVEGDIEPDQAASPEAIDDRGAGSVDESGIVVEGEAPPALEDE